MESLVFECSACGATVKRHETECPSCGAVFEEEEKKDREQKFKELREECDQKLSELSKEPGPTDYLEKLIDEAKDLASSTRFFRAIGKLEKGLEFAEKLEKFNKDLEKLEKNIENWKEKDLNYKSLQEKGQKAKERMSKGRYEYAFSILEKGLRRVERREKSERKELKKRINRTVQDLAEILEVAREFDLYLSDTKSIIQTSLELSKNGNVNEALQELENAKDRVSDILAEKIEKRISELEKKEDSIFDSEKKENFVEYLEKAKRAKDERRFKTSHQMIEKSTEIGEKSDMKVGEMSVNEIIKMKELSKSIGLECDEAKKLIKEAKKAHQDGNKRKIQKNLNKAKEKLLRKIPNEVQEIMKEGKERLKKAQEQGADISKPVSHLKQANLAIKEKEFMDTLEKVKKFQDSMEEIENFEKEISAEVKKTGEEKSKAEKIEKEEKLKSQVQKEIHEKRSKGKNKEKKDVKTNSEEKETKEEEKEELGYDIEDFYEGSTNLLKTEDLEKSYDLFKRLSKETRVGVCVAREYPDKAKKKYDLEDLFEGKEEGSTDNKNTPDISMIWLSDMDDKDAVKPKNLEKLSLKLESYIAKEGSIILFNGIEFLTTNNTFKTVLHLIQSLKDQVAVGGSILLIPVNPNALEESQIEQLQREADETFK